MLHCKQISQLASDSLELKKLSISQKLQLRMHLLMCGLCSRFVKSIKKIHAETKACANDIDEGNLDGARLPERARQKIRAMIDSNPDV